MKLDNEKLQQIVMEMIASLTEDEGKIVCPNCGHHNEAGVDKCSKCGHPRSKGSWKKAKAESLQEQEEFATASGMEQDIEMRQKRGDFEQGDYGNVGPGGGEMMDHGEYPWIKSALEDLRDDEFPDKEQAIQALAKQLGMSIKIMPSDMDEEPTMSEVKTISKKKFETTLENLVFEELARVFMEQENQPSEKELKEIAARIMNSVNKILKSKKIYTRTGPTVGDFQYDYALGIMGVKLGKTVLELSKVGGYKLANLESFVAKSLANIPSNMLKKSSTVGGSTPYMFVPYNVWKERQKATHAMLKRKLSEKRLEKKKNKKSKGKDSQGVTTKDISNYINKAFPNLSKDQKRQLYRAAFDGTVRRVDGKSIFTPSDKMKKMFPNAKPVQVSGPSINNADTLAILKAAGKPTMPTTRRTAGAD